MDDNIGKNVVSEIAGIGTGAVGSVVEESGKLVTGAVKQVSGQSQAQLDPQLVAQKQQEDQQKIAQARARLAQMRSRQQQASQQQQVASREQNREEVPGSELKKDRPALPPPVLSQRNTTERKRTIGG